MATKKMAIVLIIAFCLLCFIQISCMAKELYNYSELWNSFSSYEKGIFILGVGSGIEKCIKDIADWLSPFVTVKDEETKREEDIKREVAIHILEYQVEFYQTFLWDSSNIEAQIKITSELYEDPINKYIPIANMYFIAFRKFKGEDVESLLQKEREAALQNQ